MLWAWLGLFWHCHGPIHFNWPGQVATLLLGYISKLNVPNGSSELFGTPPHSLGNCTRCTGLLSVIKSIQVAIRALGALGGPVHLWKHTWDYFRPIYMLLVWVFIFIFNLLMFLIHYFRHTLVLSRVIYWENNGKTKQVIMIKNKKSKMFFINIFLLLYS